jgi:hypothetical protein
MADPHEHGDPLTAWRLFRESELPLARRLGVAAANLLRRAVRSPHDCCGRPGEPGC